jgi:hypothetical protein
MKTSPGRSTAVLCAAPWALVRIALLLGALSATPTLAATLNCTLEKVEFIGSYATESDSWKNSDEFKPGRIFQLDTTDKGWRTTDSNYLQDNFFGNLSNQIPIIGSIDRETGSWWQISSFTGDNNTGLLGMAKMFGHCAPRQIHPKL